VTEEPTEGADELVSVAHFRDAVRAQLCQSALQGSGVETWLSQPNLAGVAPELGVALGIEILVRKTDAAAARELIGILESGDAAIPLETSLCPACGSGEGNYLPKSNRSGAVLDTILVGLPRPDIKWMWKCPRCGKEWQ